MQDGAKTTPETTLWRLSRASMRAGLCRLAGAGLTPQEWRKQVGDGRAHIETCPPATRRARSAPKIELTTALGRQRLVVAQRPLAVSEPDAPYTRLAPDAPGVLASAMNAPATCRATRPGLRGLPVARATYRLEAGGSVSAHLGALADASGGAAGLCAPGARAVLRRLKVNAAVNVLTDAGALHVGQELWALAPPLRRALHDLNTKPTGIALRAQDPCGQRAGMPAASGGLNELLSVRSLRGVITAIAIQPANAEQCRTQPSRAAFERAVLADGCALFGQPPTAEPGKPIDPTTGCRGRKITVEVTRVSAGGQKSSAVPDPSETGVSADRRVRWRMDRTVAVIEGRGLRALVSAAGGDLDEDLRYDIDAAAARISVALDYNAEPASDAVEATAQLRAARPRLSSTVAGEAVGGNADSSLRPLFRDGKPVGFAGLVYGAAPGGFGYGLVGIADTLRELCARYLEVPGCPQLPTP